MELTGVLIVAAAIVVAAVLLARRRADTAGLLQSLSGSLQQLQGELSRVSHSQEELRQDVQCSREASLLKLADAAQGIRGEIGRAQQALVEVKALEQARARQLDHAADSLKRLEVVVAGSSTRGVAGENILVRALAQLPPDLLEVNVAFGSRIVEYALRLPGGRVLPIDSKWTSVALLERLGEDEDEGLPPADRKRLLEQVARDVRGRIREMTKYLDPERTVGLGLLAVPDAVYTCSPQAHAEGYREGVLVVPYSLALPYVLALYRLTVRFGSVVDTDQLAARLRSLDELLRRSSEEVESRLSRGLVQLQNARDALRDNLADAQRATERLLREAEPEAAPSPALTGLSTGAVLVVDDVDHSV